MANFELPEDLSFNRGPIADPAAFARDADAAPFIQSDDLRSFVTTGLEELRD